VVLRGRRRRYDKRSLVLSCLVLQLVCAPSCLVLSCLVLPCLVAKFVLSCLAACLVLSCRRRRYDKRARTFVVFALCYAAGGNITRPVACPDPELCDPEFLKGPVLYNLKVSKKRYFFFCGGEKALKKEYRFLVGGHW
jgi:predicted permease